VEVLLSEEDIILAVKVGVSRQTMQADAKRKNRYGLPEDNKKALEVHVLGAKAELAVAKALGRPWEGKFFDNDTWIEVKDKVHDVEGVEVRSTNHRNGGLLLHPADKDSSRFVLVVATDDPVFLLAGWCYASDGKTVSNWVELQRGRPCYRVGQTDLRPIEELVSGTA
jgi:hypothetical protein